MIGLLGLASILIVVFSSLFLRDYLVKRVDSQVSTTLLRYTEPNGGPVGGDDSPGGQDPGQPGTGQPGQRFGTIVVATASSGTAIYGPYDDKGDLRQVSSEAVSELVAVVAEARTSTVDLGDLGDYRAQAGTTPSGIKVIVAVALAETHSIIARAVVLESAVAAGGLALATLFGAWIIRANLRPLRRVASTATRISQRPLDRGDVEALERVDERDADPRTEVGQVGAAFNQMLGHVERSLAARQASETRVRHFVADASHELRTPLAAIRGYAELTRRGRDEVPPDIAHALSRVESESARMTTLVEDLLLLARIDSGRPLSREPVDLTALLIDRLSDAHATAPEFNWLLDLPEESVVVEGDEQRLHQVVANLLANARTHTPPGTTVKASLAKHGQNVVLTVHDNGPGIPAEFQPEIFERFVRGDSSRSRANGSTGLGLAIVAAVVARHNGTVQVTSVPGDTTFTVTLPTA